MNYIGSAPPYKSALKYVTLIYYIYIHELLHFLYYLILKDNFFILKDIIGGDEESNCSTIDSKNDRIKCEPPKKRARSKSVGVEDKVIDRGGLTASVVVAPTNDPTQPLSVVQVGNFFS